MERSECVSLGVGSRGGVLDGGRSMRVHGPLRIGGRNHPVTHWPTGCLRSVLRALAESIVRESLRTVVRGSSRHEPTLGSARAG